MCCAGRCRAYQQIAALALHQRSEEAVAPATLREAVVSGLRRAAQLSAGDAAAATAAAAPVPAPCEPLPWEEAEGVAEGGGLGLGSRVRAGKEGEEGSGLLGGLWSAVQSARDAVGVGHVGDSSKSHPAPDFVKPSGGPRKPP